MIFSEAPTRKSKKIKTCLHRHLVVEIAFLLRSKSIIVRCWKLSQDTRLERRSGNTLETMDGCWYIVKPKMVENDDILASQEREVKDG